MTARATVTGGVLLGANDMPADVTLNGVRCDNTNPPTTPTATSTLPANCPTGAFWDGFESQTGTVPAGDWSLSSPSYQDTGTAVVDTGGGGKDLRMGGQNRARRWNRESDDTMLPEQSPAGVARSTPMPVNQWTCVEFGITGSDGTATPGVDAQWLRRGTWRPVPADLRLGWQSYGTGDNTLWFDDVAVAPSRVGCS